MTAYLLVATLGFSAALALASCGKEDAQLLPGETAREITVNLDSVKQLAEEGDCLGAESAAQQVSEQIEALTGVDAKLKEALEDGASRLNEVIDDCGEEEAIEDEEVNPRTAPTEPEEVDDKKAEKEREKEEKQGEKEEREREKEEKREPPTTPSEPPAEEEEGDDGQEEGNAESPSGGVGPGSPVGEEG